MQTTNIANYKMGPFNPEDLKSKSEDRLNENELKTSRVVEKKSVFFELKDQISLKDDNS